jgi:uroporphyrinogen-III synthase
VSNTLNGIRVLVTRPIHQVEHLSSMIEQQGGVAIRFPTLQIVGLESQADNLATVTNSLFQLSNCQWLIFTSVNAVNFALKANGGKIAQLKATRIAAIGKATARELESVGLHVSLIPENRYDSESLLAMPQMQQVNGQTVLIVRGQGGREELANVLRSRGAKVGYWEVYKRIIPDIDSAEVVSLLEHCKLEVIVVTSCETLQNLLTMLGESYNKILTMIPLVVISERIRRLAVEIGFTHIAVAESPSDPAIVDTICALINERGKNGE